MPTFRNLAFRLALVVLLALGAAATAQTPNALALAPAGVEIVAHLDVRKTIDSPQFDMALERRGRERVKAQAQLIQNLTDLDIFKDIEDICLFGRTNDDASVVVVARGTFNQEKLLALIRVNKTYAASEVDGLALHQWTDDGKQKQAVFLPGGLLAIANSPTAMQQLLDVRGKRAKGFLETPAGREVPSATMGHAFWAMLVRTNDTSDDFGDFARKVDLAHLQLTVDLGQDDVIATLAATPSRPELVDHYQAVANGLLAAAHIVQQEERMAALFARISTVGKSADGKAAIIRSTMTNAEFFQTLEELEARKNEQ